MENVRHTPPERELAFLSIKGSRDLDGRSLAILRSLYQFREQEAKHLDRSFFRVIPDSALVQSVVRARGRPFDCQRAGPVRSYPCQQRPESRHPRRAQVWPSDSAEADTE